MSARCPLVKTLENETGPSYPRTRFVRCFSTSVSDTVTVPCLVKVRLNNGMTVGLSSPQPKSGRCPYLTTRCHVALADPHLSPLVGLKQTLYPSGREPTRKRPSRPAT